MLRKPGLLLIPLLALLSCDKDDEGPAEDQGTGGNSGPAFTINSPVGIYFLADGEEVIINDSTWTDRFWSYPNAFLGDYHSQFTFVLDTGGVWGLRIGNVPTGSDPSLADVQAMFAEGPRTYVADIDDEAGVQFFHYPAGQWQTACGSAQQSGSSFVIEDYAFVDAATDTIKILARFSCRIYECDSTRMRVITQGRMRLDLPCP